ncbi:histidinol-phosphatase [Pseudophaeobacter sp.]|uniref:histidinol-phosphatase n=1 Tax=Pseudophaeobacter sp. TaxID=1971739 RepID=UPI00329780BA
MTETGLSDMQVAHHLADAAGEVILPYFRSTDLGAENKLSEGFDPVTVADRAAEEAMRAVLAQHRPEDGIFGEEFPPKTSQSGRTWVLDPIDGTRGFISGTPTWGVLIALSEGAGPVLGVVDQPYTGERFSGGAEVAEMTGPLGRKPLKCRKTTALGDAVLFTTFPEVGTKDEEAAFRRVAQEVKLTRYGMDCYAYALLAAGQIDLVIEAGLQTYDVQAPIAVVKAAGGIATNWQGGPAHEGGQLLAAATPELHQQAMELLNASN